MALLESKLYPLYEAVIDETTLTKANILNFGLTRGEIMFLTDNKILKYELGEYYLTDIEGLWHYGKRLITLKRKERAEVCFNRCLEIDPTHKKAAMQLFLSSVQQENFDRALELFSIIDNNTNPYIQADLNYFLYLLSFLIRLPQEYNKRARNSKIEDVYKGDEKSTPSTVLLEKVRLASLSQSFFRAQNLHTKMIKKNENRMSITDLITINLLYFIVKKQQKIYQSMKNYLKRDKFENILWLINNSEERHNLSSEYELIYLLTGDILDLLAVENPQERKRKIEEITASLERNDDTTKELSKSTKMSYLLANYLSSLTDEYYGLENAEGLIILISADFSANNVRTVFKMNDEDFQLLLAILAKKCYQNGEMQQGDEYIEELESEEPKTRRVGFAISDAKSHKILKSAEKKEEKPFTIEPINN